MQGIHCNDGISRGRNIKFHAAVEPLRHKLRKTLFTLICPPPFSISGNLVGKGAIRQLLQGKHFIFFCRKKRSAIPVEELNMNNLSRFYRKRKSLRIIVCHAQDSVPGRSEDGVYDKMFPPTRSRLLRFKTAIGSQLAVNVELIIKNS